MKSEAHSYSAKDKVVASQEIESDVVKEASLDLVETKGNLAALDASESNEYMNEV